MSTSRSAFIRQRHPWLAAFALLAFTVRALIPAGFMPSGDGLFGLQICPEGLSAGALAVLDPHAAHHQHSPGHDHKSWASSHCAFGTLAGGLPNSHLVPVALRFDIVSVSRVANSDAFLPSHRFLIAQPRGPPFLA